MPKGYCHALSMMFLNRWILGSSDISLLNMRLKKSEVARDSILEEISTPTMTATTKNCKRMMPLELRRWECRDSIMLKMNCIAVTIKPTIITVLEAVTKQA